MGGGILIGVFWGLLFTAFVAAVASLNTPLPTRPGAEAPDATPPVASEARNEVPDAGTDPAPPPGGEAARDDDAEGGDAAPADSIPLPSGSEFNRPPPDEAAVLPGTDVAPGIDVPGAPPMPLQTFAGGVDTAPAPRPDVTAAPNAPRAPVSDRAAVAPPAGADAPAQTAVRPGPILAPAPDPDASPDTATPDANAPAQGADPLAQPAPVESQASRDPGTRPSTRLPPPDMSGASENAAGSGPESPAADVTATAGEPAANEVEGGSVLQFVPPRASGAARSGADADPDTMSDPSADMTAPSPRILRPGGDDAGDTPRRLPQIVVPGRSDPPGISDAPPSAEATDAVPDGPAEDSPAAAEPDDIPAIVAHAAAFDAAETGPLLAVVLIDEPDARLDLQTLTDFSFPVAFAVDPMRPGAADRAAAYRAAGFEVLLLASAIPEGATAGDTEVALAAAARRVPEAVALIDTPESRMQGDRAVLEAAIGVAAGAGQGLLAFPRGLNTAEQMAGREGVPAATLFRLLDADDESAAAIARQLGRAEFAAVQKGAAVVAGHTRPDTVTALYSWALGNRNEAVAIAPVSAVLMRLSDDD